MTDIVGRARYRAVQAVLPWRQCMKIKADNGPLSRLSTRECEILKLVAQGWSSREIAAAVGVRPGSVYTYRSRIMTKLQSKNVATLVRLAIRHRLVKP